MIQALTGYFNKCFSFVKEWVINQDNTGIRKMREFFILSKKLNGNPRIHSEKFIDTSALPK